MELRKMTEAETLDVSEIYSLELEDLVIYHNINIGIFIIYLEEGFLIGELLDPGLEALLPEYTDQILKTLLTVCKVDKPETIFIGEYISYADKVTNFFLLGVLLIIVVLIFNYLGGF